MKRILFSYWIILLFLITSNSVYESKHYAIGRDQSWFPAQLGQMTPYVNKFTDDIVQELANVEKKYAQIVDVSWSQLIPGLNNRTFDAVFTSLSPNLINQDLYTFSKPFLLLGPVLVITSNSKERSLEELENKIVGAYAYDDSIFIIQKYPTIVIKTFQDVALMFEALIQGKIDAALAPNLSAHTLIAYQYFDSLVIASDPLSDYGLRLITLKNRNKELLKHFNYLIDKHFSTNQK